MSKVKATEQISILESKHTDVLKIAKVAKNTFIIICGDARMTNKEFKTKADAEQYIGTKPYELLINLMFYTMQKIMQHKKEEKQPAKEN